jgi:hypothetical protein
LSHSTSLVFFFFFVVGISPPPYASTILARGVSVGFFWDRVSQTICLGLPLSHDPPE